MLSLGGDTGWASPPSVLSQLVPKLSRNYLKEGYMEKTGPKVGESNVLPGLFKVRHLAFVCLGVAWGQAEGLRVTRVVPTGC